MQTYQIRSRINDPWAITLSAGKRVDNSQGETAIVDLTAPELAELAAMIPTRRPEFLARLAAGPTELRPNLTLCQVGDEYFDTSLGRPVWCAQTISGAIWVDSTGATV